MHALEKFKGLLGDIFQFESSDLDFGIYRILNYKQKEVEEFIDQKLPQIIEDAFQRHKKNLSENIHQEYERVRREIIRTLGNNAFTPTGELNPVFADTPLGQEYLRIKEQKELLEKLEEIKEQVYNDLYSFFSRFYEDGDFIPQYRYSKEPKYSIPYNGEEVKLYWANAEFPSVWTNIHTYRRFKATRRGLRASMSPGSTLSPHNLSERLANALRAYFFGGFLSFPAWDKNRYSTPHPVVKGKKLDVCLYKTTRSDTGFKDYLYNVKYKDSTWIAMLENRLRLAKELLNKRRSIWWK